jgi:hypothetical protein
MQVFFANIYLLFDVLFGANFWEYLWGYNCETEDYSNPNIFYLVGLITCVVSGGITMLYYHVINHPYFEQRRRWLITLAATAVINLCIAWGIVYSDFINGVIGDCMMYARDDKGGVISQLIYPSDCWMFGMANMIVSAGFFVIFSFIFFIFEWRNRVVFTQKLRLTSNN